MVTDFPNRGSGNRLNCWHGVTMMGISSRAAPSHDAIFFSVSYLDILKLDRADLDEVLPANISKSAAAMTA